MPGISMGKTKQNKMRMFIDYYLLLLNTQQIRLLLWSLTRPEKAGKLLWGMTLAYLPDTGAQDRVRELPW